MTEEIKPHGNYDDESERQLRESGAQAVVLIVIGGNKGNGFSVIALASLRDSLVPQLPELLRDVAGQIEAQLEQQKKQ
jgi:hypothetical protein